MNDYISDYIIFCRTYVPDSNIRVIVSFFDIDLGA